ncbi:MAG: Nif3-like dinuclear metal center hexameric protein [Chlorobi bacterium]|nr:Nif3-like dinuclear metal center hexameric protein [Chlorobiota bacterium]
MLIKDITNYLETLAPLSLQENYDNAGLITGDANTELKGTIITLDTIPEVVDEAIQKNVNLIISHHPIIFKGLKKINGNNYTEKTIIKAIKHDIAIYAIHTNLDNIGEGVNLMLCKKLNLINCKPLVPLQNQLRKLVTFIPQNYTEKVRKAIFEAGAGHIGNYDKCSFNTDGTGTYRAGENTNPFAGEQNKEHYENETRIETVFPYYLQNEIISALVQAHPYEEVAYDIYTINNVFNNNGAGMIGETKQKISEKDFLEFIKSTLKAGIIRHTALLNKPIKKVALCGGSGSFLLKHAIKEKADIYISSDFKYHEFFDADNKILIADAGHFETEQFTKELIFDILTKKFNNFACFLSKVYTNPINYL